MIKVQDALSWLNYEEGRSHLSYSSHFSVWQVTDTKLPDTERDQAAEALLVSINNSTNPLEKAEVNVDLAVYRYTRGHLDQARRLILEAAKIYDERDDCHRQAVAEWIAFIVRYGMLEQIQAHSHARAAREIFIDRRNIYKMRGKSWETQVNWYGARIKDMTSDLDTIPEEALEWLDKFEPTKLSTASILMRNSIRELITRKSFTEAYQKIESMRNTTSRSPEVLETAEAQAFCGLSVLQMGNTEASVPFLRAGMASARHASHQHNVIRWMLGLVLFRIRCNRCEGINHLEAGLRGFEGLSKQADRQNKSDVMEWYQTQADAMQNVLKELVRNDP